MIDIRELRIGNIVNCEFSQNNGKFYKPITVHEIHGHNLIYNGQRINLEHLEALPLTFEVFTLLGFNVVDDNPKQKQHYEGDVLVDVNGYEFSNSGGINGFRCFMGNSSYIDIETTHHFQNWYYFTFNSELDTTKLLSNG